MRRNDFKILGLVCLPIAAHWEFFPAIAVPEPRLPEQGKVVGQGQNGAKWKFRRCASPYPRPPCRLQRVAFLCRISGSPDRSAAAAASSPRAGALVSISPAPFLPAVGRGLPRGHRECPWPRPSPRHHSSRGRDAVLAKHGPHQSPLFPGSHNFVTHSWSEAGGHHALDDPSGQRRGPGWRRCAGRRSRGEIFGT